MADEAEAVTTADAPEVAEVEAPEVKDAPVESDEPIDPFEDSLTPDEEVPDVKTKNATEDEDAGGEEEGKAEDAEEPDQPVIPEELLARAEQAGFSKEEALQFGDPKLLELALKRSAPVVTETKPAAKQEAQPTADAELEIKLAEMKPEEGWEPDVIKNFTALRDYSQKQAAELKALKTQFGAVHEYVAEQNRKAVSDRLDGHFASAAEQYGEVFGKGSMEAISGTERVNRIKVVSEMHALESGYRSTGQKVPDEKTLIQRAMRNVFGEDAKKVVQKEIAEKMQARKKQFIAKPTHKKGSPNLPPDIAATRAVAEQLKVFGQSPDEFQ